MFYGYETATVRDANGRTPREYYALLKTVWSKETCAPRLQPDWTPDNPTLGQCSITAFLLQDLFGGRVYGVPLSDGNFHCFNRVGDCVFDLTSEQFGDVRLDYEHCPEQCRSVHFAKEEKRLRYEALKTALFDRIGSPVLSFRPAEARDCALILSFIRELALYERMPDEVVATEALLREWLFEKHAAEVLFICESGKEVGFALFFRNFSTFVGRAGLYLEDLYIRPAYRRKGYGKAILKRLASIAVERGCGRMEWVCLDWNRPSIDFYLSLGAKPMDEWTVYRVTGDALSALAEH